MLTRGVTLVELLVVLVLMGLAAGIVAPVLLPDPSRPPDLDGLLHRTQVVAARRAETLQLTVQDDGRWQLDGAASATGTPLATGRLTSYAGGAVTLVVSPLGLCGVAPTSAGGTSDRDLDPLTCAIGTR